MAALSRAKAEPSDPIRGILNDITDWLGFPRVDAVIPPVSDAAHVLGLPNPHEALPAPGEVGAAIVTGLRTGKGVQLPAPKFPVGAPLPSSLNRELMTPEGPAPSTATGSEQSVPLPMLPMPPLPPLPGYGQGMYYQPMMYQPRYYQKQ